MNLLFVRNLTVIDFSYLHPERGVVGESWIVDVELEGDLDEQGMVFDFGHVKKVIKAGIDQAIDHKLVVPRDLPDLDVQEQADCTRLVLKTASGGRIEHISPHQAVALFDTTEITPSIVAPLLSQMLQKLLPDNVKRVGLTLREEAIPGAFYHYSHGLKKHRGNCQRIAHGHRSSLEIRQDNQRNAQLELEWAKQWQDIYVGTREDLTGIQTIDGIEHSEFRYAADQGEFYLSLPSSRVYLIDTDTTVEWIAVHIANVLKGRFPQSQFEICAYEGVDKGAIAIR